MFKGGFVNRDFFIEHIIDNGAIWAGTEKYTNPLTGDLFPVHSYISIDGNRRVVMAMPQEDIPKLTALSWLRSLGLKN